MGCERRASALRGYFDSRVSGRLLLRSQNPVQFKGCMPCSSGRYAAQCLLHAFVYDLVWIQGSQWFLLPYHVSGTVCHALDGGELR